jgi:hypothetical protein
MIKLGKCFAIGISTLVVALERILCEPVQPKLKSDVVIGQCEGCDHHH